MFAPLLKKLFGSKNEREVKRMLKAVQAVNGFEEQMLALSDEQLRAKTEEFKARLAKGETLDQLLAEAFAVAREAGKRVMGMRHFDVQLIGGMTLHEGKIAEMRTGEGKTLVATLAVYLNALSGKGVHVVTVNDYLAKRDAEWMGKLYNFLGKLQNRKFMWISNIYWADKRIISIHRFYHSVYQIINILKTSCLLAFSINRNVLIF